MVGITYINIGHDEVVGFKESSIGQCGVIENTMRKKYQLMTDVIQK